MLQVGIAYKYVLLTIVFLDVPHATRRAPAATLLHSRKARSSIQARFSVRRKEVAGPCIRRTCVMQDEASGAPARATIVLKTAKEVGVIAEGYFGADPLIIPLKSCRQAQHVGRFETGHANVGVKD
eukprot:422518-Prorocentrum_minimum.AAC.3